MIAVRYIFIIAMIGGVGLVSGLGLIASTWRQSTTTTEYGTTTGRIVNVDPNVGNIKASTRYFEIVYEYRVDNRVYQSDRYAHSELTLVYQKHREKQLIEQYVAGNDIQVFYDVANPSVSVLRKGPGPVEWFKGCFGGVICLGSICAMVVVEVARRAAARAHLANDAKLGDKTTRGGVLK